MAKGKQRGSSGRPEGVTPAGVWNRGTGRGPTNPIRVRTKRLDEIDSDKIALAYWLLAKQVVVDGTGEQIAEAEARRVAAELDASRDAAAETEEKEAGRDSQQRSQP